MKSEAAKELAERFHATYELLAPQFGYETREETREFDPASPNGKLMIAVCQSIIDAGYEAARPAPADEEVREAMATLKPFVEVEWRAKIVHPKEQAALATLIAAVSADSPKEQK